MRFVSRLAWGEPQPGDVEVAHVRGVPVDAVIPDDADRIRFWPNRLGILERGSASDTVIWEPELAPQPRGGTLVQQDGNPMTAQEFVERLAWFRKLMKRLTQIPGVEAPVRPDALCTILLTPGIATVDVRAIQELPLHLGEFPGGVQLALRESDWLQSDQYAQDLHRLLTRDT